MKRFLSLLSLAPVLLLLACNLQMPNAVQIKGSPDFRFAAKFDMGDYLAGFFNDFKEDKDEVKLLDCEKTGVVTYLVYMKLFNEALPLDNLTDKGMTAGVDFVVPEDIPLTTGKLDVPSLDFGDFLDGFTFNQGSITSRIYVSGSPIVNCLSVKLTIKGSAATLAKASQASGLDGKTTYDKAALPENGTQIDLPFDGNEVPIDYTILIGKGETIKKEWTNAPSVFVEIAVWLPFEFTANKDKAELKLPDDLFSEGDLFGRENSDSGNTLTEMLESLNFAIKMNTNPFTGASLIVESKGIQIINSISGASLGFAINEQNMKAINSAENFPFAPQLKLVFNKGGMLSFPRNFIITEITFKAKLNHTIDLSGGMN